MLGFSPKASQPEETLCISAAPTDVILPVNWASPWGNCLLLSG